MSFSIVLKKNISENNCITKSFGSDTITLTGNLREDTSILNPVITVEVADSDLSTFLSLNYADISAFNRSYFIKEVSSIRNHIFELTMHVDVLSSFASEIKANKAIIARQENKWYLDIDDGALRSKQNPYTKTVKFPRSVFGPNGSYVLVTAGGYTIPASE